MKDQGNRYMKNNGQLPSGMWGVVAVFLLALGGCARYADLPAGTVQSVRCAPVSPVVEQESVAVPAFRAEGTPPSDYLVGPGDVIYVSVYGRPDLGTAMTAGGSKVQGTRVDGNGHIRLPLLGSVKVDGLRVEEVRQKLEGALGKYLQSPSAVVEVAEYKSQPIFLLGQFKVPGAYYMDRPLTLLQGIAQGSGFDPASELREARLIRDKKTLPVDIYGLLMEGDTSQNVWLKPGDTIYVPDNRAQNVFVFGAVKKPGPVQMPQGGLNLAQAIATAELRDTGFNDRQMRIIRSLSPTRGELIVVDFARIVRGEAVPYQLKGGDIVYVPKSGVGNWNDAINEILPSLQAISALLQPFVNIKFLSQ